MSPSRIRKKNAAVDMRKCFVALSKDLSKVFNCLLLNLLLAKLLVYVLNMPYG